MNDLVLLAEARGPQWPDQACILPKCSSEVEARHRMSRAALALNEQAEEACAGLENFNACVQDVVLTGEIGLADAFF